MSLEPVSESFNDGPLTSIKLLTINRIAPMSLSTYGFPVVTQKFMTTLIVESTLVRIINFVAESKLRVLANVSFRFIHKRV